MEDQYNKIDELFKESLIEHSPKAPEGAWDNIALGLKKSKPKRVLPLYLKIAASAALLIGTTSMITYLLVSKPDENTSALAKNQKNTKYQELNETSVTEIRNSKEIHSELSIPKNNNSVRDKKTASIPIVYKSKTSGNSDNNLILSERKENAGEEVVIDTPQANTKQKSASPDVRKENVANNNKLADKTEIDLSLNNGEEFVEDNLAQNNETNSHSSQSLDNTTPTETKGNLEANNSTKEILSNQLSANDLADVADRQQTEEVIQPKDSENKEMTEEVMPDNQENLLTEDKDLLAYEDNLNFDEPKKKKEPKWMIGGQAGPVYNYRQIEADYVSKELMNAYNESDGSLVTYAGGVNIEIRPVRRLSIQSGVYYSKMGMSKAIAKASPIADNDVYLDGFPNIPMSPGVTPQIEVSDRNSGVNNLSIVNTTGNIVQASEQSKAANNNTLYGVSSDVTTPSEFNLDEINGAYQYYEMIELPLIARYYLIDRKINFHLLGGISANFLVGSPVYLDNGDYYGYTEDINTVNYSSTVGLGVGYLFNKNLKFTLEPQVKYFFTRLENSSQASTYPYTIGVMTGITYLF